MPFLCADSINDFLLEVLQLVMTPLHFKFIRSYVVTMNLTSDFLLLSILCYIYTSDEKKSIGLDGIPGRFLDNFILSILQC